MGQLLFEIVFCMRPKVRTTLAFGVSEWVSLEFNIPHDKVDLYKKVISGTAFPNHSLQTEVLRWQFDLQQTVK